MGGRPPPAGIQAVFHALEERYGEPETGSEDAFPVLIATILSHRTNDDVTLPAARRLLTRYPDAQALAQADPAQVEERIQGVGFYRNKTQAVIKAARHLLEHHDGRVPREEGAMLEIPWVGRKTMNCVKVYAFGEPVVAVDTHVHRISNRLGWCDTGTPDETEVVLDDMLDEAQKLAVNELLVRFGREICRPIGPKCGDCPIAKLCPSREDREPEGLGEPEGRTMLARIAERAGGEKGG
ncbi:MAG: endonuclease III [Candidatus Thermoplasmatota archaeon]|nr:endonuclease III [Candidatus Thermoplasmatota archaeon]